MRYLVTFLIALLPFAIRADDKTPPHDELLVQAAEKGPASAVEYIAGIRRAIAAATRAKFAAYGEAVYIESYPVDDATFLTLTDLSMLRELVDQLDLDSSKLPHRDPENPQLIRVPPHCFCIPEYTVVLYRNAEMIAALDVCHITHMHAQDYTDRVEFPEISGGFDYYFTKADSEKVRTWEEKYHIKELMMKHAATRASAKE
jgi:hypothetical protein